MKYFLLIVLTTFAFSLHGQFMLPIKAASRFDISQLKLTNIGAFGIMRKARKTVPAHYHTGIDIRRPSTNYINEPIFPLTEGVVISKRTDGAYAQLIIEHKFKTLIFWTLYEHIAGVIVNVNDRVKPLEPIARYMNREELNRYGWQFDHFHLEILKVKPTLLKPDMALPQRFFGAYTLQCFTLTDLNMYYYNPLDFIRMYLKNN